MERGAAEAETAAAERRDAEAEWVRYLHDSRRTAQLTAATIASLRAEITARDAVRSPLKRAV